MSARVPLGENRVKNRANPSDTLASTSSGIDAGFVLDRLDAARFAGGLVRVGDRHLRRSLPQRSRHQSVASTGDFERAASRAAVTMSSMRMTVPPRFVSD